MPQGGLAWSLGTPGYVEEILVALLQFLIEFVLNVLVDIPFELFSRKRATPEPESIASVCTLWLALGAGLAWLSLLVFPRSLITVPELRVVNAVLAPVVSACISQTIAKRRATRNPYIVPGNHFWFAFWFTVGLVAVRLAYGGRA